MNQQKLLILLVALVLFVNYDSYFKPNIQKKYSTIELLENRITQERVQKQDLNMQDLNISINYADMMYDGKKYSYSQAMGKFQEDITKAAEGLCSVEKIMWAQVATKESWYEKLRMNLFLNCTPDALHQTASNLKATGKLYYAESFLALKIEKKSALRVKVQLVGFRRLDENR